MLSSCMDFLEVNRRENCVYYNFARKRGTAQRDNETRKKNENKNSRIKLQ